MLEIGSSAAPRCVGGRHFIGGPTPRPGGRRAAVSMGIL